MRREAAGKGKGEGHGEGGTSLGGEERAGVLAMGCKMGVVLSNSIQAVRMDVFIVGAGGVVAAVLLGDDLGLGLELLASCLVVVLVPE